MTHHVAVVPGEGVGPEITQATLGAIKATGVDIAFEELSVSPSDPAQFIDTVVAKALESDALMKGPLGTPLGGGKKSLNVSLRTELNLYANVRPIMELPGVGTRLRRMPWQEDKIINFLLVRENLEDLYIGQERRITPNTVVADKVMTVEGCERIVRASFELARQRPGEKAVCCAHKANILKQSEGMLLDIFERVKSDYPEVKTRDLIIDNTAQQLILNPFSFEVVFMSNLHGDILSDQGAAIVGGLGLAGSANIGDAHAMFEAVHGTANDIAGLGQANPTSLMLSSVLLLRYLGESDAAKRLLHGVFATYERGEVRTFDQRTEGATVVSTTDFGKSVERAIEQSEAPQDSRFLYDDFSSLKIPSSSSKLRLEAPVVNVGLEVIAFLAQSQTGLRSSLEAICAPLGFTLSDLAVSGLSLPRSIDPSNNSLVRLTFRGAENSLQSHENGYELSRQLGVLGLNVRSMHFLAV